MSGEPKINNVEEIDDVLKFTLCNTDKSIANGIRRVMLSEIPCYVFKTTPYTENKVDIKTNKSRMNNELIKQRMSCIPIHINNVEDFPIHKYLVELDIINDTNANIYATTGDFKIKNIETKEYMEQSKVREIFPPNSITGDYINILRLRPKLTDTMDPEQIQLEATLQIGTGGEDGTFSVVGTCAYGFTLDPVKVKDGWAAKEQELKTKGTPQDDIDFIHKDWHLLDAKRKFINDSFDFTIETVGTYTNFELMDKSCGILIRLLSTTLTSLKTNTGLITDAIDTQENCYNIVIKNEDYTVGKIIEYMLYTKYFQGNKQLKYAGFLKKHPHDTDSLIKISAKNRLSNDEIISMFEDCIDSSIGLIMAIQKYFVTK